MNHFSKIHLIIFITLISLTGCFPFFRITLVDVDYQNQDYVVSSNQEAKVFKAINIFRMNQGLIPLQWSETAADQCRYHSFNMARGNCGFSHNCFPTRILFIQNILVINRCGENIGWIFGKNPVSLVINEWLNQPHHLANIVGNFNFTGVGVVKSPDNKYYYTQIFVNSIN